MGAGRNRNENVSMVRTGLIAGVCPPVLLSKANNQDPLKPPGRFKHATVCEDIPIHFVESGTGPFTQARVATETPGIEGRQRGGSPIVLDLSMIQNWLQPALAWLADECDQLCSDRALYQRLVQDGGTGELRNAAILAHHMGDDDVLAETLKAAKAAYELDIVRRREHWSDFQPGRRDRQTRYPQDWSHQRFLQSLEISDT